MAKVFSHTVFKGSGSVGATYYRKSRGRSILCQKPGERPASFKGLITEERCIMACIGAFAAMHATSIINSFNRTKYGSHRNYFTKVNYAPLKKAFSVELVPEMLLNKQMPTPEQIEMAVENYAVAHPTEIFRIKKTGQPIVMLADGWDDADDPIPAPTVSTLEYVLDSEYRLKSIVLAGENLNSSIGFELKDPTSTDVVLLSGTAAISAKGKAMTYSVAGNVPVIGTKLLQARYGQEILISKEVEGDDREYVAIYAVCDPVDGGSVSGDGQYAVGSTCRLVAVPSGQHTFAGWYKGAQQVSLETAIEFVVSAEETYTAKFNAPLGNHTLTLTAGNNGKVKIGDGAANTNVSAVFMAGTSVMITAVPNADFVFQKWSDGNMQNPRTLVMPNEDTSLTATFESEE